MAHPPEFQRTKRADRPSTKGVGGHKEHPVKPLVKPLGQDPTMPTTFVPKVKLSPEDHAAGRTPNSGKLKKDGTPVPGQTPEKDAERAAERAGEAAGEAAGEVTPSPVDPGSPPAPPPPLP